MVSCTPSYRSVSIFEPIEDDVLFKAKEDSTFLLVYDIIDKYRDKLEELTPSAKVQLHELTYDRVCTFIESLNDSLKMAEIKQEWNDKYEAKLKEIKEQADKYSTYEEKYKEDYSYSLSGISRFRRDYLNKLLDYPEMKMNPYAGIEMPTEKAILKFYGVPKEYLEGNYFGFRISQEKVLKQIDPEFDSFRKYYLKKVDNEVFNLFQFIDPILLDFLN